jgi:hypothetical protein
MSDSGAYSVAVVGGFAASIIGGYGAGSFVVFGIGCAITTMAAIAMSRPAGNAWEAGMRAHEYGRRHFGLTGAPMQVRDPVVTRTAGTMNGHPLSKDTAPGDMSVEDFNRATRIGGQPLMNKARSADRPLRHARKSYYGVSEPRSNPVLKFPDRK